MDNFCVDCGKKVYRGSIRCVVCFDKFRRIKDASNLKIILREEEVDVSSGLVPVDIDLVNSLRLQGRFRDADALVLAHQLQVKKGFGYVRKMACCQDTKIRRFLYKSNGCCVDCGKKKEKGNDKIRCLSCLKKHRDYVILRKVNKK